MKSRELLKLNDQHSLVEIEKGNNIEYCVCSYYDESKPEGSKWSWGHYFLTMEHALKYAALECFSPVHRYVLIETDTHNNITEKTFSNYDSAYEEFKERFDNYADDEFCIHAEIVDDGKGNTVGELWYEDDYNDDIELKIIDVIV